MSEKSRTCKILVWTSWNIMLLSIRDVGASGFVDLRSACKHDYQYVNGVKAHTCVEFFYIYPQRLLTFDLWGSRLCSATQSKRVLGSTGCLSMLKKVSSILHSELIECCIQELHTLCYWILIFFLPRAYFEFEKGFWIPQSYNTPNTWLEKQQSWQ